jgi:hypothetical protein
MIRTHAGQSRRLQAAPLAAAVTLLCLLSLMALGCGKTGLPQPNDPSKSFAWKKVEAKPIGNCLAFIGSFEGAYEYFDGMRLEIAPLNDPSDCPGCPFVPREVTELSPSEANFNPATGSLAFSYCPQKANAYRWRLAGISEFSHLPHAGMNDRLLIVNQEAFAPLGPVVPAEPEPQPAKGQEQVKLHIQ